MNDDYKEFGNFRKQYQDDYGDGTAGAPLYFVKKVRKP